MSGVIHSYHVRQLKLGSVTILAWKERDQVKAC